MLKSIKKKILLSQISTVLFVSIVMGFFSVQLMKSYLDTVHTEKLEFIANHYAEMVEHVFMKKKSLMKKISGGREIEVYKRQKQAAALQEYFDKFKKEFHILSYVNREGIEEFKLADGEGPAELRDVRNSAIFREALENANKTVISYLRDYPDLDGPGISVALAKYSDTGNEFMGVLIGAIPLADIIGDIVHIKIGETGFCGLIDSDGYILSHPLKEKVLHKVSADGAATEKIISSAAAQKRGFGRGSIFGIDGFSAYAPVQETGWSVIAFFPYDEFISGPNILRNTIIATFFVVFALALVISLVVSGNISRPVINLVETSRAIAKGDLTRTLTVKSEDEVGMLTEAFNDMTRDLKRYHDELMSAAAKERVNTEKLQTAYDELRNTQAMLIQSEKLAALGELGAGMAHELNSPLAGVLSLVRSIKIDKDSQSEEYSDLDDIEKACVHMANVISDFSTFTRKSSGEPVELNVIDVIESILSFAAPQLIKNGVSIERNYEEKLPLIKGDKNQLSQVVLNMITNARDAIDGEGKLNISAKSTDTEKGEFVEMVFSDTGCGITKENIEKIFDPFFTTKRPGNGVGLGLSISHTLIRNHNGEILVESEPDRGATFTIRLPVLHPEMTSPGKNA